MSNRDRNSDKGTGPAPVRLDSTQLLGGRKEITIVHKGTEYRLRLTSNDKLILIK